MLGEGGNRMAQHDGVPEREVLLGQCATEPSTSTGRDNERVYGSHARIYRTIRGPAMTRGASTIFDTGRCLLR